MQQLYHIFINSVHFAITNATFEFRILTKTNIMPITKSIMLFYREAFPVSYQFVGCALIWYPI